jgi:hypothetical protein
MRTSLQATTVFNAVAAFSLAFPASILGELMGLPQHPPFIYRALAAGAVGLFGAAYAWLSTQATISRPVVALSAAGKLMAFCAVLSACFLGEMPWRSIFLTSPDPLFAAVFIWWLGKTRQTG